jgi:cellobiose epimerase
MDAPFALLRRLSEEMQSELVTNLLPFWLDRAIDDRNGGFVGRVDADGRPDYGADKGGILNARILWTFSAAYRALGDEQYRHAADRAFTELEEHFWDHEHGGVFWMLSATGTPVDERKHVYAQAFAIFAYSEYYRATGEAAAIERALTLFRFIETIATDSRYGGYAEAFSRDWQALEDVRLSDKDDDVPKSTNTHLHLLEAYANLLRCWPDRGVHDALTELLQLFVSRIYDSEHQSCVPFFDEDWTPRSSLISFGHDIETSWLLTNAAALISDDDLRARVITLALELARSVACRGVDSDGGLLYTADGWKIADTDKHWWPQAEAIVGFLNAWEITGDITFVERAVDVWDFTRRYIVDAEVGEWHERVDRHGTPYPGEARIHQWKCPYHSARACLEVMHRTATLAPSPSTGTGG